MNAPDRHHLLELVARADATVARAERTSSVPIAEELFFRGFLSRRCISANTDSVPIGRFTWFSFLVVSVV